MLNNEQKTNLVGAAFMTAAIPLLILLGLGLCLLAINILTRFGHWLYWPPA